MLLEVTALVRDTTADEGACAFADLLVAHVARWSVAVHGAPCDMPRDLAGGRQTVGAAMDEGR